MKFVMDERIKHRLTGLVVIISIAVIFLPAMLKKSNKRFEENVSVSLKLPNKPIPPKVAIPNQQTMFKSVKVAHVEIPTLLHEQRLSQIAKAEPLTRKDIPIVKIAKAEKPALVTKEVPTVSKPAVITSKVEEKISQEKNRYAVQIASFIQKNNAESLVSRLRKQGYSASYNKFIGKQGEYYQVLVGQLKQKDEALLLQKKLASNLQLSGLIVKTGVS